MRKNSILTYGFIAGLITSLIFVSLGALADNTKRPNDPRKNANSWEYRFKLSNKTPHTIAVRITTDVVATKRTINIPSNQETLSSYFTANTKSVLNQIVVDTNADTKPNTKVTENKNCVITFTVNSNNTVETRSTSTPAACANYTVAYCEANTVCVSLME